MSIETRSLAEAKIQNHMLDFFSKRSNEMWGIFWPLKSEPNLRPIWGEQFSLVGNETIQFCFPVIDELSLSFYHTKDFSCWMKNSFGVMEPKPHLSQKIETSSLDGVLIPGVAFDRKGFRLGRGKGFYDQTLAHFQGVKLAVAFQIQLFEEIPVENHDVPVELILTENGFFDPAELGN